RYEGRFLNIANPWTDKRLLNWQGYHETHYFDADNRAVPGDTPGARPVDLIPLAIFGLDHPKIPILLVDFRDTLNPKRREMSRPALQDLTKTVLALSRFGDLPYFLGHTVFDFITNRRGMDINQPARLRAYSQLKLLLALNDSLNAPFRSEVNKRLEKVSLNPAENDLTAEARLAQQQYEALLAYARDPNGLAAKLDRDRRAEMTKLDHGKFAQSLFKTAKILTVGRYVHREPVATDMLERLDVARSLAYHTRFLTEVSHSSPQIEVVWDLAEVRRSLEFITAHGLE